MTRTSDMKEIERQIEAEKLASEKLSQYAKDKEYLSFCIYADALEAKGFKINYLGDKMWNAKIVKDNWELV